MIRQIRFGLGLIVLLFVSAIHLIGCAHKTPVNLESGRLGESKQISIIEVRKTTVPKWLEATGTLRAQYEATLSAKVMGRVSSIVVREGDLVTKGQSLAQLEAGDLGAAVDVASANLRSSVVAYDNSRTVATMEASTSSARIAQARSNVQQAQAMIESAKSKLQLVLHGPRKQEKIQAGLAVKQAEATLKLAQSDYARYKSLYEDDAISRRQFETVSAQLDVAKAQYDSAVQSLSMANEGSRTEDIQTAREGVRQAEAAYATAKGGLLQAEAAALQTNVRRKEINAAQAQISQSQASLRMAQVTRSYARIVAPFDGVVSQRLADPGTMAAPGVPLIKVEGGTLRLEAIVPESALSSIKVGQTVTIELDALPNKVFEAKVVEIRPQGDTSTHTFLVRAQISNRQGALSGMFGRVNIPVGTEKQVMLPSSAVWEREGLYYAFVVNDEGKAELRLITIGKSNGASVIVLSGLTPGEKVLLNGRSGVKEGDSIAGRS